MQVPDAIGTLRRTSWTSSAPSITSIVSMGTSFPFLCCQLLSPPPVPTPSQTAICEEPQAGAAGCFRYFTISRASTSWRGFCSAARLAYPADRATALRYTGLPECRVGLDHRIRPMQHMTLHRRRHAAGAYLLWTTEEEGGMKRHWSVEDLSEHWTLTADDFAALSNIIGSTCLGFAVLWPISRMRLTPRQGCVSISESTNVIWLQSKENFPSACVSTRPSWSASSRQRYREQLPLPAPSTE